MSWKTFLALTIKDYSSENKVDIDPSHKFYYVIIATIIWCFSIIIGMVSVLLVAPYFSEFNYKIYTITGLTLGTLLSFIITYFIKRKVKINSYDRKNLDFQAGLILTSIIVMTLYIY